LVENNAMNHFIEPIAVPRNLIRETIVSLRNAGERNAEGVVLWLGKREDTVTVVEAYVPEYESEMDFFHIPRESMAKLLRHCGETRTFLAAQVHSHPFTAFHSEADDRWAIVRHVGAMSLVVPDFAATTTPDSFIADIAGFSLSPENVWRQMEPNTLRDSVRLL
jgi:hypothetical protein